MKNLTPEEKKIIENAWDIIRTLSPESVPVKNSSEKLQKQKYFKEDISKIQQCLDNIYNNCPYSDNHEITMTISDIRHELHLLISRL